MAARYAWRFVAAFLVAALAPTPALAWSDFAHRAVASIAMTYLSPQAKREVATLIASEALLATPTCPIRSIEDASVWADCVRNQPQRFGHTRDWHYVNVPVCGSFSLAKACSDGECVTGQIEAQARILADKARPKRQRLEALAWIVHLVGDMHQPLHVGDNGDRGGNGQKIRWQERRSNRMNLHSLWDQDLPERALGKVSDLRREISAADRQAWKKGGLTDWARESWRLSRDVAYGRLPQPVCNAASSKGRIALRDAYYTAVRDTVRLQVKRAGVRLAHVLNAAVRGKQPAS